MRRLKTLAVVVSAVAAVGLGQFNAAVAATTATTTAAATPAAHAGAATHLGDLTSSAPVTVVASGLDEPRSLAWGPHGHLLVAEAGTPPPLCSGSGFALECWGLTGSISDVSSGTPVRIVTGLASDLNEQEVVGPDGMVYAHGHLYALETGSPQGVPSGLPADLTNELKRQYGALLDVTGRSVRVVANPGYVDYVWSQAHVSLAPNDFPDANPYAVVANPHGGFYLVDAASNTLD